MKSNDNDPDDVNRRQLRGGLQLPIAVDLLIEGNLDEGDRRIIGCLGAAVVSVWEQLPSEIRNLVLTHAMSSATYDAAHLRNRVGVFLRGKARGC